MNSRRGILVQGLASTLAFSIPQRVLAQTGTLRVASPRGDAFAEAIYANDQGFFKDAGLNVELTLLGSGPAILAAVTNGTIDIGIAAPLAVAHAVAHGLSVAFLCPGGMYDPRESALCVLADGPVKTARDLEGQTVGVSSLGDISALATQAWVDQNGGNSKNVRILEVPFAAMPAALHRGTVTAVTLTEPVLSQALRDGGIRVLTPPYYSVFGQNFFVGGWFAKTEWIANNTADARRFVKAIYVTGRWAQTHLDASSAILARVAGLDPAIVRGMNRSPFGTSLAPSMIQPILDLAVKYKFLDAPMRASDLIANLP